MKTFHETFAPNDGVLPGIYSVAVSCYAEGEKLGEPGVPERYLDPRKSGLRATVGYSAAVIDFEVEGEIESTDSMIGRN